MKYRKKPVVIEALQLKKDNEKELMDWIGNNEGKLYVDPVGILHIETLEGNMKVSLGDFIIKGVKGEFYPCKPDIFEATYEEVKK